MSLRFGAITLQSPLTYVEKVDVTVNSPESGTILELYAQEGDTVSVGGNLFKIELGDAPKEGAAPAAKQPEAKKEAPKEAPKVEQPKAEAPKPAPESPQKTEPLVPKTEAPAPGKRYISAMIMGFC